MNKLKTCISIVVVSCVSTISLAQIAPGETAARSASATANSRNMSTPSQETGSIIKKDIRWDSKIPLNKTYAELTPEQKTELRKMYENLPEGDEPPFPEQGMKPIFSAIRKAQRIRQARGELNMAVTVDAQGNATKVEDRGGVYDAQMTEIAQQVLLLTKYKPAVCGGQPCTMQFRFTQKLKAG